MVLRQIEEESGTLATPIRITSTSGASRQAAPAAREGHRKHSIDRRKTEHISSSSNASSSSTSISSTSEEEKGSNDSGLEKVEGTGHGNKNFSRGADVDTATLSNSLEGNSGGKRSVMSFDDIIIWGWKVRNSFPPYFQDLRRGLLRRPWPTCVSMCKCNLTQLFVLLTTSTVPECLPSKIASFQSGVH